MTPRAWALFVAMSLLWGIPYFFIKVAVEDLHPFVVVFSRTALGAAVLLPFAARTGALRALRGRWRAVALLTALEVTIPFLLITYGELRISSSLTGLLIASLPLLVALLALWVDHTERVSGGRLVGLLIGFAGVALLLGLDIGTSTQLLGAAAVMLATLSYAGGVLTVKRAFSQTPPLGVAVATLGLSSLVLAPLAALHLPAQPPRAAAVGSIVGLGVLCSAAAFVAYFALVGEAGASRASVITYVNPAVAVALGVILLGESITAVTVAGFLLIIAGSWLSTGGTPPPGLVRLRPGRTPRLRPAPPEAGPVGEPGSAQLAEGA
jgi:drug/metabolite transporter (DMT)-like permease